MCEEDMLDALRSLEGMNAGQICHAHLNCDHYPSLLAVLEAAFMLREDPYGKATWRFVAQFSDGTTLWRSPEGAETATVALDGSVAVSTD